MQLSQSNHPLPQHSSSSSNSKQLLYIYMDGEPYEKILKLDKSEYRSLRVLKKKILNQFGYEQSQGKKIVVNIMQIYINQPQHYKMLVLNDHNLKLIMDFIISFQRPIKILVTIDDTMILNKKQILSQQAIEKGQVHFDQNGSLVQDTDQMKQLIPTNQKYDNSLGNVRCEFCQKNNQDINYLKKCGGMYGPFAAQKYTHLLCAIWCHKVFLNQENGLLMNVEPEMKRAASKSCTYCKEKGAGLLCVGQIKTKKGKNYYRKCNKSYHFKCAYDNGCHMNWIIFQMLCTKCSNDDRNQEMLIREHQNKICQDQNSQENQNEGQEDYNVEQYEIHPQQHQKSKVKFQDFRSLKQSQFFQVKRQHI